MFAELYVLCHCCSENKEGKEKKDTNEHKRQTDKQDTETDTNSPEDAFKCRCLPVGSINGPLPAAIIFVLPFFSLSFAVFSYICWLLSAARAESKHPPMRNHVALRTYPLTVSRHISPAETSSHHMGTQKRKVSRPCADHLPVHVIDVSVNDTAVTASETGGILICSLRTDWLAPTRKLLGLSRWDPFATSWLGPDGYCIMYLSSRCLPVAWLNQHMTRHIISVTTWQYHPSHSLKTWPTNSLQHLRLLERQFGFNSFRSAVFAPPLSCHVYLRSLFSVVRVIEFDALSLNCLLCILGVFSSVRSTVIVMSTRATCLSSRCMQCLFFPCRGTVGILHTGCWPSACHKLSQYQSLRGSGLQDWYVKFRARKREKVFLLEARAVTFSPACNLHVRAKRFGFQTHMPFVREQLSIPVGSAKDLQDLSSTTFAQSALQVKRLTVPRAPLTC